MGAIGDYIHYTAQGYEEHGITRNGQNSTYTYAAMKQNIAERANGFKKMPNQKQYEDAVNSILSTEDHSPNDIETKIQNEIEQILQERFAETLGKINWDTGNVSAGQLKSKQGEVLSKIQVDSNQNDIQLKTIVQRIRSLEAIRDSLKNVKEQDELTAKINQIYRELNMILTDGKKIGQIGYLKTVQTEGKMQGNRNISLSNFSGDNNLITQINTLMKAYAAAPAINLQKGDLFEYVLALAPAIARVKAGESLKETIEELKNTVAGGDRSKITIDFDKNEFTQDLDMSSLDMKNYVIHSTTGRTAISYGTSQEKIDIQLSWEGKIIPVSAKNVNFKSGNDIHILSGSSFLYLIQDEDPNFINHYLNIVAQHGNKDRVNNSTHLSGNYQQAHEAMKAILLFKALSGDTFGREKADIFIVNDNSGKNKVKIYSVYDIVNRAVKNIDSFAKITSNGGKIEDMSIPNNWSNKGYSDRITAFVSALHQQKISAALKISALNTL